MLLVYDAESFHVQHRTRTSAKYFFQLRRYDLSLLNGSPGSQIARAPWWHFERNVCNVHDRNRHKNNSNEVCSG